MIRKKALINGGDFSEPSIILSRLLEALCRSLKAPSTSRLEAARSIR
jgi:hypothetical protein